MKKDVVSIPNKVLKYIFLVIGNGGDVFSYNGSFNVFNISNKYFCRMICNDVPNCKKMFVAFRFSEIHDKIIYNTNLAYTDLVYIETHQYVKRLF